MEPKTKTRRTSKRWLAINSLLAWGAIYYAVYDQQGAVVVGTLTATLASIYGAYTGVGHLDFRQVLKTPKE